MTEEQQAEEVANIKRMPPGEWPLKPFVTMKNVKHRSQGKFPTFGFVYLPKFTTVYDAIVFDHFPIEEESQVSHEPGFTTLTYSSKVKGPLTHEEIDKVLVKLPRTNYGSIEEMVADGWIVD